MEYGKELDRLTEFAEKIMQNTDITQKGNGLNNLLAKVKNTVPDVITDNSEAINNNTNWRFNRYIQDVKFGFINSLYNDIIYIVNEHITDIINFENDTPEQQKQRQNKLIQYSQTVGISPIPTGEWERFSNGNVRVERQKTKPHPDIIYCQNGIYRQFEKYSKMPFYCIFLNIKRGFCFKKYDFVSVCKLVCLYIALKNEYQRVIEEMQLLGIVTPQPESPKNPKSENNNQPQPAPHFTRVFSETEQKKLYEGLTNDGFLPKGTIYSHFCHVFGGTAIPDNEKPFKPLQWIQTNRKTKGINPNIRALFDMLVLFGIPENEIKDKALINAVFEIPNGTKIKSKHYTDITDNKGNLKPFKSEYHNELAEIVSKSKENQSL
jgi:hypothetical protein